MRVGGYGSSAAFRRNSETLGDLSRRSRGSAVQRLECVAIPETQEAMLSSLCNEERFSLLATHLMNVCGVLGNTRVRYGRLGKTRSIVVNDTEYQELGGKVQKYELG